MTLYRIRWKGRPWGQLEAISAPDAVTRFWDSYPADMRASLEAKGITKEDFTASPEGGSLPHPGAGRHRRTGGTMKKDQSAPMPDDGLPEHWALIKNERYVQRANDVALMTAQFFKATCIAERARYQYLLEAANWLAHQPVEWP